MISTHPNICWRALCVTLCQHICSCTLTVLICTFGFLHDHTLSPAFQPVSVLEAWIRVISPTFDTSPFWSAGKKTYSTCLTVPPTWTCFWVFPLLCALCTRCLSVPRFVPPTLLCALCTRCLSVPRFALPTLLCALCTRCPSVPRFLPPTLLCALCTRCPSVPRFLPRTLRKAQVEDPCWSGQSR